MVGERKVLAERHPFKILAVFALAFMLQGMSMAVFRGDRPARKTVRGGPRYTSVGTPVWATKVFSVTIVEDGGPGSLRQAILDANGNPGIDEIRFVFAGPITLTLNSPLLITDPVSIEAHGPWITDTVPGWLTVDGHLVTGDLFVVSNAAGTSIQRLRVVNVNDGYGFMITGTSNGTAVISNTIQNSFGGIQLQNTSQITVTHNTLLDLADVAVDARGSDELWLQENMIRNIGRTGIRLLDGVRDAVIISNTISGILSRAGVGISVAGDPAPTGVVMRGNTYTDTRAPIFLGPGANDDFPAPEIIEAFIPINGTIAFSARSPAAPITYTYPLTMDIYRVRNGDYVPLGKNVPYEPENYPAPINYSMIFTDTKVLATDQLALIATTANPSTSEFSPAVEITPGVFNGTSLYVKAFLEGPYDTSTHKMNADLVAGGVLPLSQPFSDPAFDGTVLDFDSTQSVASHPDNTVDWLLVNLRTNTNSASTVVAATHAAVVFEGGTVVSAGDDSLRFADVADGSYHLVLRSRNHLDIMSDTAIVISDGVGSHDFTPAGTAAFGANPQKELETGVWGMFAGDGSVDGQVTALDFNAWLVATKAVAKGYLQPDFNLDMQVTAPDFNLWLMNTKTVASSKVP